MAVHNALQAYESRKAEIINFEVGRLREGTQLMNRSVWDGISFPFENLISGFSWGQGIRNIGDGDFETT